jgi:hypothetical protein
MFTLLVANVFPVFLTRTAFRWNGLEHAGEEAIPTGALHVISRLGPGCIMVPTG